MKASKGSPGGASARKDGDDEGGGHGKKEGCRYSEFTREYLGGRKGPVEPEDLREHYRSWMAKHHKGLPEASDRDVARGLTKAARSQGYVFDILGWLFIREGGP